MEAVAEGALDLPLLIASSVPWEAVVAEHPVQVGAGSHGSATGYA